MIPHRAHCSLGSPVDDHLLHRVGQLDLFSQFHLCNWLAHVGHQVPLGEFLLSVDGELVGLHAVGAGGVGVVLLDVGQVGHEDGPAVELIGWV